MYNIFTKTPNENLKMDQQFSHILTIKKGKVVLNRGMQRGATEKKEK